ncbi:hypothetical protein [Streptomyces sp. MNU89]|uniref:hypothetical protein n=1 Tax=Streptomyces sp. MNU89 TaxID=2560025 RepID=UPI001E4A367E|nr:hypothetical protein [Streptomyces sp. MNU89]MCC9740552.1 hypothetical protein [Streptomyces sp. MNU89]
MTPVFRARLASGLLAAAVLVPAPLVLLHDRLSGDAEPRAASSPTARRDGETAAGRRAAEGAPGPAGTRPAPARPSRTPSARWRGPWFPPAEDHGAAAGGRRPDLPYGYRYEDEAYPYGPRPYEWSPDRPGPPEKGPDGGTETGGTGGATDAGPGSGTDSGTGAPAAVRTGRPAMRVLPLGTGLVLVGLGLGFIGLRLRRG